MLTFDRSLALLVLLCFCLYGYSAFFVMDAQLPPFAKLSPVWPSSFPKLLALLGLALSLSQVLKPSNVLAEADTPNWRGWQWKTAMSFVAMMVSYAVLLRPIGFVASTVLFLMIGAALLGARQWWVMSIIALMSAFGIWYLVDPVLGIYLRPWPAPFYGGA